MLVSPIDALRWGCAVVLAAVFAVAAGAKLRDRAQARAGLEGFGVPQRWSLPALAALIAGELLIAALLAAPDLRRLGALGALGALALFTAAIAWQLLRGRRPACACFGSLTPAAISGWSVARNLALIALAALAALPDALGAPEWFGAVLTPASALWAWAALSCIWLLLLTRQNGRLLLRLADLERRGAPADTSPAPAGPVRVGDTVPSLGLRDSRGRPFDLRSLAGRPQLLLFLDGSCAHCRALLARLREEAPLSAGLTVISADAELSRALPPSATLLLDPGWSTTALFGLRGTPAAVLVGADGTLERAAVHGASPVGSLLDQLTEQEVRREVAPV